MNALEPPTLPPLHDADQAPVTLTQRVADQVRDAIAAGQLRAGMRLSVPQLAKQLGASRTPVREALLLLENAGLVRFERNRGVRIVEPGFHDLVEIFAMRLMLEVPASRRAAARLTAADRDALLEQLDTMRVAAAAENEPAFMGADRRFHDALLRSAGNRRLAETVATLIDQVRYLGASTVGHSRDLAAILAEHERIADAALAGDGDAAARAMHRHLRTTAELLIAQVDGPDAVYDLVWPGLGEPQPTQSGGPDEH